MVLLYLLEKIVCYIKLKIIAFFFMYKVCDVNSIPANLRNSKPWTFYRNSLEISFDKSIQSSMLFLKTLGCKNDVLEYEVKLEKC